MIQVLREVLSQKIARQIWPKWKMNKVMSQVSCESLENDIAYADEPLADEEWLKKYKEEVDETNKLEEELRERLEGSVQVDSW